MQKTSVAGVVPLIGTAVGHITNAVNWANSSALMSAHMGIVQPLHAMVEKTEQGLLAAKNNVTRGDIPMIGGLFKKTKDTPIPVIDHVYRGVVKNPLQAGLNKFQGLSEPAQDKIKKHYKTYTKVMDGVGLAGLGTMAYEVAGGEKLFQPKIPQAVGASGANSDGYVGKKLERINFASGQDGNPAFANKGVSMGKILHPENYPHNTNQLAGMKQSSCKTPIRKASEIEIPMLFDLCMQHPDEFVIHNDNSMKLAADRLLNQDTYIQGDLMKLKGFINGGFRDVPNMKTATSPYYIRFVYVNPSCSGQGVAGDMIEQILDKSASTESWMYICENNSRMQKVASRSGFSKISSSVQDNTPTGIWYRRNQ